MIEIMDYMKLSKDFESSMEELSKMTFDSLNQAFEEVTNQWDSLLGRQTGCLKELMKSSNILLLGITEKRTSNKNAFILLRLLGLARKKTIYVFYDKTAAQKAMEKLIQDYKNVDKEIEFHEQELERLQNLLSSTSVSHAGETVPESRFNNLAASYQRVLMHTYEIQDKEIATSLIKDVKMALHGQGMDVVEYDGSDDKYFDVREDPDCTKTTMVTPAIIRRNGDKIIAQGIVYKP